MSLSEAEMNALLDMERRRQEADALYCGYCDDLLMPDGTCENCTLYPPI